MSAYDATELMTETYFFFSLIQNPCSSNGFVVTSVFLYFPWPSCGFVLIQSFNDLLFSRERLRTHSIESSGKLKISPEHHCDFTAEDLKDLGEIGRGAYGSVNKMVHKPTGQIMAVKVFFDMLKL